MNWKFLAALAVGAGVFAVARKAKAETFVAWLPPPETWAKMSPPQQLEWMQREAVRERIGKGELDSLSDGHISNLSYRRTAVPLGCLGSDRKKGSKCEKANEIQFKPNPDYAPFAGPDWTRGADERIALREKMIAKAMPKVQPGAVRQSAKSWERRQRPSSTQTLINARSSQRGWLQGKFKKQDPGASRAQVNTFLKTQIPPGWMPKGWGKATLRQQAKWSARPGKSREGWGDNEPVTSPVLIPDSYT